MHIRPPTSVFLCLRRYLFPFLKFGWYKRLYLFAFKPGVCVEVIMALSSMGLQVLNLPFSSFLFLFFFLFFFLASGLFVASARVSSFFLFPYSCMLNSFLFSIFPLLLFVLALLQVLFPYSLFSIFRMYGVFDVISLFRACGFCLRTSFLTFSVEDGVGFNVSYFLHSFAIYFA